MQNNMQKFQIGVSEYPRRGCFITIGYAYLEKYECFEFVVYTWKVVPGSTGKLSI